MESTLEIRGTVRERSSQNPNIAMGEIEVVPTKEYQTKIILSETIMTIMYQIEGCKGLAKSCVGKMI